MKGGKGFRFGLFFYWSRSGLALLSFSFSVHSATLAPARLSLFCPLLCFLVSFRASQTFSRSLSFGRAWWCLVEGGKVWCEERRCEVMSGAKWCEAL